MSEQGIGANGQTVEILNIGGRRIEVDAEIAPVVAALNAAGEPTLASCSGHGYRPATIALQDGRWIVIAKDMAEFRKIEALFPIDINGKAATPPVSAGEVGELIAWLRRDADAQDNDDEPVVSTNAMRNASAMLERYAAALEEIRSTCNYGVNSPDEALAHVDELARAALSSPS